MTDPGFNDPQNETYNGTRKLVRPRVPEGFDRRSGNDRRHGPDRNELINHSLSPEYQTAESSHAEAFYFQKQIQQQTEMTIVLDDGEHLNGVIEWYDRGVLKLRSGRQRTLIYKASIKYMYKTSENGNGHAHVSLVS